MQMDGMLTIKMAVILPTTKYRMKRVTLAKSWCKRSECDSVFAKFLSINDHINPTLLRVEWIAQESVFAGDES
jgi:predicted solute-binding protein